MSDEIVTSGVYQQVDAVREHLQQQLDSYRQQIRPDINLASEAFDLLWHGNPQFRDCASSVMHSSPIFYSPAPLQTYLHASLGVNEIVGLRLLRPLNCMEYSPHSMSVKDQVLIDYIDDVRSAIPAYEEVTKDISQKYAAVNDILRDARQAAGGGLLDQAGLSVDGYIVATVCIPEQIPTAYHQTIASEGLEVLDICNAANISNAKAELRFLCDSTESCAALVNGLPRVNRPAKER